MNFILFLFCMEHILRCGSCGAWTMDSVHSCGGVSVSCKPPKFSLVDKYADYRRTAKRAGLEAKGLL